MCMDGWMDGYVGKVFYKYAHDLFTLMAEQFIRV